MKGMLVGAILAGAFLSSGCATMAAILTCGDLLGDGNFTDGCSAEVVEIAGAADGKIFDAVFGPDDGYGGPLFERVSVEGVVTSGGSPLYQARAELSLGSELWTVRTDRSGRYQIHGVVKPGHCSDLRFTIRHPDRRVTGLLPVECGEQRLDFDFPSATTS